MNYLTYSDKSFLQQLNLANRQRAATVLDGIFGTQFAPTVGARVIIYGSELCDMYDHAPGVAFYTRDAERPVVFLGYIEMSELRETAVRHFQGYADRAAEEGDYDGKFRPWGIRILNPNDEVIDLYVNDSWVNEGDDLIPCSQWEEIESQIARLRSNAYTEAGWDNFETARGLRQHAQRLEDRLSTSRYQHMQDFLSGKERFLDVIF